jgi:hypothetical protein
MSQKFMDNIWFGSVEFFGVMTDILCTEENTESEGVEEITPT